MLLMQLTRIDLRQIFDQGFRLIVFIILLVNYVLLFFMHFFMVRPLYSLCGHKYFSLFSRWMFMKTKPSNVSSAYWEIKGTCYITNILDVTMIGFACMFLMSAVVETVMSRVSQQQLLNVDKEEVVHVSHAVMRQRISRKAAFRRLIFRMTISLITAIFASVHFISIFATFLLFHLIQTTLSEEVHQSYKSSIFALQWQIVMYLILSFFFSGLMWSVQGIHKSQLKAIYARSKRQEQFRRMNEEGTKSVII